MGAGHGLTLHRLRVARTCSLLNTKKWGDGKGSLYTDWGDGKGSLYTDGGTFFECMGCRKELERPNTYGDGLDCGLVGDRCCHRGEEYCQGRGVEGDPGASRNGREWAWTLCSGARRARSSTQQTLRSDSHVGSRRSACVLVPTRRAPCSDGFRARRAPRAEARRKTRCF